MRRGLEAYNRAPCVGRPERILPTSSQRQAKAGLGQGIGGARPGAVRGTMALMELHLSPWRSHRVPEGESPGAFCWLPSPEQHHRAGNAHHPEQIQPQAGVHRPISRPFPRVHRCTHRNGPMVPKQNPHQCSATGGGFFFRAHLSRLSGTRCLPMVPQPGGGGSRGMGAIGQVA